MNKICYIGYYSDPNPLAKRQTAPAAVTKMDYIIDAIRSTGRDVKMFALSGVDDRTCFWSRHNSYSKEINAIEVHFPKCYSSKIRVVRVLLRWLSEFRYYVSIIRHLKRSHDIPVVYHSLGLVNLLILFRVFKIKYILEIEEIYTDVISQASKRLKRREYNCFKSAYKYILSTDLLKQRLNLHDSDCIICNGTYKVEPIRGSHFFDNKIHCVYAGTFDPRKGGAAVAVAAAAYLPKDYRIHVCGFGGQEETESIKRIIEETNAKGGASVSYEGCLLGESYISFLQRCDIGLSTQNPHAAFNATSFPSKVLSYLSNGLSVVSIRIPAIEHSEVGGYLYYYDEQTPEKIAQAIMSVPKQHEDNRKVIENLNSSFVKDLDGLLNGTF